MAIKVRATMHNGRTRATGEVYSVKHNDRNYDTTATDNINPAPERKNRYFTVGVDGHIDNHPAITFEKHEQQIYFALFSASLAKQTARHIKAGHAERVRTVDDYRTAARTCPEETILQLGTREQHTNPQLLLKAVNRWCQQMQRAYGTNWRLLDGALHFDEATPHCHIRAVWTAEGSDGLEVSQNKALKELGIQRPDTNKPQDRHNNPKQTFTQVSRQIWISSAREYGIEIEEIPETPGKLTLTKEEYIKEKLRQETEKLASERAALQEQVQELQRETARQKGLLKALSAFLRPFYNLVEKLARLKCVDGKTALEHCRDLITAMQNATPIDTVSEMEIYQQGNGR